MLAYFVMIEMYNPPLCRRSCASAWEPSSPLTCRWSGQRRRQRSCPGLEIYMIINSITYTMFAYNVRWTSQLITHVYNQKVTIAFCFFERENFLVSIICYTKAVLPLSSLSHTWQRPQTPRNVSWAPPPSSRASGPGWSGRSIWMR